LTGLDSATFLAGFIVFCRIGACLSFAPGFSSPRIPVRVRLLMAIGLTAALSGPMIGDIHPIDAGDTLRLATLVVGEFAIGAAIGLMARLVFASLETMFTAASMTIGASSIFSQRVDESESMPEFASLIVFATTALMFIMDLHWEIVRAIFDSYAAAPLGSAITPQFAVVRLSDTLSFGFSIAFRLASPFLVFGLVSNFAFALINKITPQIAVYFVAAPFILFGGLMLLTVLWADIATLFLEAFRDWLLRL